MNDNVYQMKLTTEYEERIYVIQAEATTNIESTIDEQKEASKALRYFTDEIMERALAIAAWNEQRNG